MKKIKAFKILDSQILTPSEMKMVAGGVTDYKCNTGAGCQLYVRTLGVTLYGTCYSSFSGGQADCYCQNGAYRTDPSTRSHCWIS